MERAHDLARTRAVVARRADLRTLAVTGEDRLSWLQGLLTCDVSALAPNAGRWGLVLTKPGKILSDVYVVPAPDRVLVAVPALTVQKIRDWFEHHLIMEDADVADVSSDFEWALVHGPRAQEVAPARVGSSGGVWASLELTGLGDAALCLPRDGALPLERSGDDTPVIGEPEWHELRIERLVPLFGMDMTEENNPHDVSLERRVVSWDKGCYLGQEAVCMQDMRGKVKRRLVLVALNGSDPPARGTEVLDETGAVVGETRSAAVSHVFEKAVALSIVRVERAAPGTRLTVGGVPSEVVVPR